MTGFTASTATARNSHGIGTLNGVSGFSGNGERFPIGFCGDFLLHPAPNFHAISRFAMLIDHDSLHRARSSFSFRLLRGGKSPKRTNPKATTAAMRKVFDLPRSAWVSVFSGHAERVLVDVGGETYTAPFCKFSINSLRTQEINKTQRAFRDCSQKFYRGGCPGGQKDLTKSYREPHPVPLKPPNPVSISVCSCMASGEGKVVGISSPRCPCGVSRTNADSGVSKSLTNSYREPLPVPLKPLNPVASLLRPIPARLPGRDASVDSPLPSARGSPPSKRPQSASAIQTHPYPGPHPAPIKPANHVRCRTQKEPIPWTRKRSRRK